MAVVLLIGAPAALLVAGRVIVRATDMDARRAAVAAAAAARVVAAREAQVSREAGEPWYHRPMRPAFGRDDH